MHIFLTLTILPTKIYYFLISQFIEYSITYFWFGVELGVGLRLGLGIELGVGVGVGVELGVGLGVAWGWAWVEAGVGAFFTS